MVSSSSTSAINGVGFPYLLSQERTPYLCRKKLRFLSIFFAFQKQTYTLFHFINNSSHSFIICFIEICTPIIHISTIYCVTFQYATLSKPCTGSKYNQETLTSDSDSETPKHHPRFHKLPSPSKIDPF